MKHTAILIILAAMLPFSRTILAQTSLEGSWSGDLKAGQTSITLVLNFVKGEDGELSCTLDSPDQGAKGIQAELDASPSGQLTINIPSVMASWTGMLYRNSLTGTFTQMGQSLPLTFNKGVPQVNRPQNPKQPYPYRTEEVVFTNVADEATLAGTISYPIGYDESRPEDVPVVLMVTGSGLENRDEEVFDHKPFLVIADHLARHGIATLRFDDRGYGESHGGEVANATTEDFMRDAMAGIEFLRGTGKFGKTGVLGHSEGGSIAFMLGSRGAVDFVISLAGIGVKGDEALAAQAGRIMELSGQAGDITAEQYRQIARAQNSPWLNWFIDYDPTQDIAGTKCPAMAINGDLDCQVLSSINLKAIRDKLPSSGFNLVKEYPGLNHVFQHCTTGAVTEYRSIEETISPEVLDDLVSWIYSIPDTL